MRVIAQCSYTRTLNIICRQYWMKDHRVVFTVFSFGQYVKIGKTWRAVEHTTNSVC